MSKARIMTVAFRVDASLDIGSGHVMRCITLAEALRQNGAECHFICRELTGHLMEHISKRGFTVSALPPCELVDSVSKTGIEIDPPHGNWLACDWMTDARQTGEIIAVLKPDWLVLDHYALDRRWEDALRGNFKKLIVIDDLADRPHACDLLLDQNLGRSENDYAHLVPDSCTVLAGPQYALLRPEFAALREYSLKRRETPSLKRLLIAMGGVDQQNATGQVLESLKTCPLPADCHITVVMGGQAPWLSKVREMVASMPWKTEVRVNINDMAKVMADSDLAIGAAGSTSWERCCLGLPTLLIVLAENQWTGARALQAAGAARLLGDTGSIRTQLFFTLVSSHTEEVLAGMSRSAREITDGLGAMRVVQEMECLK